MSNVPELKKTDEESAAARIAFLETENADLRGALTRIKNIAFYGAILYFEASSRFEKIERITNSFIYKNIKI